MNVLYDRPERAAEGRRARSARCSARRWSCGGTITGEHGVGLAKRDYLALEQGAELIELQRRLKAVFDPDGMLNPGKIFPDVRRG